MVILGIPARLKERWEKVKKECGEAIILVRLLSNMKTTKPVLQLESQVDLFSIKDKNSYCLYFIIYFLKLCCLSQTVKEIPIKTNIMQVHSYCEFCIKLHFPLSKSFFLFLRLVASDGLYCYLVHVYRPVCFTAHSRQTRLL